MALADAEGFTFGLSYSDPPEAVAPKLCSSEARTQTRVRNGTLEVLYLYKNIVCKSKVEGNTII